MIAQRLCDDIVEPSLVRSSLVSVTTNTNHDKASKRAASRSSSIRPMGKPTTSIIVEQKKVTNILPRDSTNNKNRNKPALNKFRSNQKISIKQFTDIAVNTIVTGPLKCDNNCLTLVKKRNNSSCRCNNKRVSSKADIKERVTKDNSMYTDKACYQVIEKENRGTQFLERLSEDLKNSACSRVNAKTTSKLWSAQKKKSTLLIREFYKNSQPFSRDSPLNLQYYGARRWALPNSDRKPDF